MDQKVSRPVRWNAATRRAINALDRICSLHAELMEKVEEIEEEWNEQSAELDDALLDLVCLQSEYEVMATPENLYDSRFHEKRRNVEVLRFDRMRESVPRLRKLTVQLEEFDTFGRDDFTDLYEARQIDLPKGYGRD